MALLVEESTSEHRRALLASDGRIVTWWGSWVECASALNRRHRESGLDGGALHETLQELTRFAPRWLHIRSSPHLRQQALRLLRTHPLRAADALQLAAALTAAMGNPSTLDLVCSDARLSQAAQIEGFLVL